MPFTEGHNRRDTKKKGMMKIERQLFLKIKRGKLTMRAM